MHRTKNKITQNSVHDCDDPINYKFIILEFPASCFDKGVISLY